MDILESQVGTSFQMKAAHVYDYIFIQWNTNFMVYGIYNTGKGAMPIKSSLGRLYNVCSNILKSNYNQQDSAASTCLVLSSQSMYQSHFQQGNSSLTVGQYVSSRLCVLRDLV